MHITKFANGAKLGGAVDCLKGQEALQKIEALGSNWDEV